MGSGAWGSGTRRLALSVARGCPGTVKPRACVSPAEWHEVLRGGASQSRARVTTMAGGSCDVGCPGGPFPGPDFVPTPRAENRNGKGEAQLLGFSLSVPIFGPRGGPDMGATGWPRQRARGTARVCLPRRLPLSGRGRRVVLGGLRRGRREDDGCAESVGPWRRFRVGGRRLRPACLGIVRGMPGERGASAARWLRHAARRTATAAAQQGRRCLALGTVWIVSAAPARAIAVAGASADSARARGPRGPAGEATRELQRARSHRAPRA